jgi:hypothetical protein
LIETIKYSVKSRFNTCGGRGSGEGITFSKRGTFIKDKRKRFKEKNSLFERCKKNLSFQHPVNP